MMMRISQRGVIAGCYLCVAAVGQAVTLAFSNLSGPDGDPYYGHIEQGYIVTPRIAPSFQAMAFGNLAPSIVFGYIPNLTTDAAIRVSRSDGGLFSFKSADVYADHTAHFYFVKGWLQGRKLLDWGGFSNPGRFFTHTFRNSIQIDLLEIEITATDMGEGDVYALDNIVVEAVPEPNNPLCLILLMAFIPRHRTERSPSTAT